MSPYADLGILWVPGARVSTELGSVRAIAGFAIFIHGSIGYDVRLTSQSNEAYVTASAGVGYAFSAQ